MMVTYRCPVCGKQMKIMAPSVQAAGMAVQVAGWLPVPEGVQVAMRMPPGAPHACGDRCLDFLQASKMVSARGGEA